MLANLTLDGLEMLLQARYGKRPPGGTAYKVHFCRYADDWIITGNSKDLLEHEVKPLVIQFLKDRGLELSPEKTCLTHIEDGFDFLGQRVRKYNGKLLIKPTKKNVKRFLAKVRKLIHANRQAPAGQLLAILNPVIRGWSQYHQHVVSKAIFSQVDHAIFQTLWRWAVRRHPNKGKRWIKQKYFKSVANRHWVFYVSYNGKDWSLSRSGEVVIKRHVKVQGAANPYDPTWEVYFEHRLGVKMADDLRGGRQLIRLWREQDGLCSVCQQKITRLTGWHNHHIIWRSLGGSDKAENRVPLHPNCHQQVHSKGLFVEKPRPSPGV